MRKTFPFILITLLLGSYLVYQEITYQVTDEFRVAIIRFGEIERIAEENGLYFKTPLVQRAINLEKGKICSKLLPDGFLTPEESALVPDLYAIWRIERPQLFVETTQGNTTLAGPHIFLAITDLITNGQDETLYAKWKTSDGLPDIRHEIAQKLTELGIDLQALSLEPPVGKLCVNKL